MREPGRLRGALESWKMVLAFAVGMFTGIIALLIGHKDIALACFTGAFALYSSSQQARLRQSDITLLQEARRYFNIPDDQTGRITIPPEFRPKKIVAELEDEVTSPGGEPPKRRRP